MDDIFIFENKKQRHLEGVAQVNMASPEEADTVIQMMNGRFFGKRKLTADHWDGKTKYKYNQKFYKIIILKFKFLQSC